MFDTVKCTADGAGRPADGAEKFAANCARGQITRAQRMAAWLDGDIFRTEELVADATACAATVAAGRGAGWTDVLRGCNCTTSGAMKHARVTKIRVGRGVVMIKAWPDQLATACARNNAVAAEALAASRASGHLCAKLLAAGAAHGAVATDQGRFCFSRACGIEHGIQAQVAGALARTASNAFTLTGVTSRFTAGGAAIGMFGAGARAAGPAEDAALLTILPPADGATVYAAFST